MFAVKNVKYHPNIEWEDYLNLPGYSFSYLKNDGAAINVGDGIRIGKAVHTYLLKPKEYNWEHADIVIPIARRLKDFYIPGMEVECGITAEFHYDGLFMPYRGMPDEHMKKRLVIDYKIINGDLGGYVKNFKYDEQLRGYMMPPECPLALIIAYNKKTKAVQTEIIKPDPRWWIYKIKQYGKPSA